MTMIPGNHPVEVMVDSGQMEELERMYPQAKSLGGALALLIMYKLLADDRILILEERIRELEGDDYDYILGTEE